MGMMTRRNVKQRAVAKTAPAIVNTEVKTEQMTEPTTEVQYTKTEINRMPVEQLRKMAMNTGVDGADTMTGKELKEYLIDVFNL